jgi:protocatechuate 3,4-dioxygenase beta subunit
MLASITGLIISVVMLSLWLVQASSAEAEAGGGIICGAKFNDLNGDGIWDMAAEPTLPGWEITVQGAGIFSSTVTDADGRYCFTNLPVPQPDTTFQVMEQMQPGWQQTFPQGGFHIVILQPGQGQDDVNFGNHQGAAMAGIHGRKFYDANNNGQHDPGEQGLPNWTITLVDSNGLPISTTTNAQGRYWFTELLTDTYTISEVQQNGWTQTFPISPSVYTVLYVPSQSIDNLDFGNYIVPGEIHGMKFLDQNGDGIKDANEPGLSNWAIQLQGNNIFLTTYTDQDGNYWFMDLPPGSYTLSEIQPPPVWNGQFMVQWVQTFPPTGTHTIDLDSGEVVEDVDFGNWQNGKNDFCMLPWDNHFLNQTSLITELYIFNASTDVQKGYTVQFVGPTTFTAAITLPIYLNPYQYGIVPVQIAYPSIFTGPGQNATFQAIVTNLTTNTSFTCSAALWSYSPQWWTSNNVNSGLGGGIPLGFTQNISFTVTNNGGGGSLRLEGGGTVTYTIMAMSRGMSETAPIVSLNGLPPGSVITGEITLQPGETADIPLSFAFTEHNILAPTDIVFMLDMDGVGEADAMTYYLALPDPPRIYLPLIQTQ